MAKWNKCVLTNVGAALTAKAVAGDDLVFTRAQWGVGVPLPLDEQPDMTALVMGTDKVTAQITSIVRMESLGPLDSRVRVSIQLTNEGLVQALELTECGLFARDQDSGIDVLFAYVSTLDGKPMDVDPGDAVGNLKRVNMNFLVSPDIITKAIVSAEGFLTVEEAKNIFALKEHVHTADQVMESTGETTEVAQRRQDAAIKANEAMRETGTNAAEITYVGTVPRAAWSLKAGYYNAAHECFEA